jgi:hypothetical protein
MDSLEDVRTTLHGRRRSAARPSRGAVAAIAAIAALVACPSPATAGQWYRTDTHSHSSVSGDALDDLGLMSQRAKASGYNAVFVTDHGLASEFPINTLTANHMVFEDSYTRWTTATYSSLSSQTNSLASTPRNTGSSSLHLQASSSSSGEAFVWTRRGPNFRSGDILLEVSVFPTRIDAGSGVYVSASIGQDPTVESTPLGYTTQNGVISPGKTTVLVWQLGSARTASSDPNRRVLTYSLPYTLNQWNTYTINVSQAIADIPAADRPVDYYGLAQLKMAAAAANGGTADAYFDTYSIDASQPDTPADEYVYRNGLISIYDTSTFKLFPSVELGIHQHTNRFNFGFANPTQFVAYPEGIDGIFPTQQTGYPAQLNHPGSPGGVTAETAVGTQGNGADLIEVGKEDLWTDIWDDILVQGTQIIGTGSTDKHEASYGSSSIATMV